MKIDFHTHAFEDDLADKAMAVLQTKSQLRAPLDGKVSSLLASLEQSHFDGAVVCPIATKPKQWDGIRQWAHRIMNTYPQLTVLGSVHPADEGIFEHIDQLAEEGFKGVKFHPYYQEFSIDESRMFPIYEHLADRHLFAVFHTGFDIGFPFDRIADPIRIRHVTDELPHFTFIATHLGGWQLWDEVCEHLLGRNLYIETSFSLSEIPAEKTRYMLLNHPAEYILFGTDSPWQELPAELNRWDALHLPSERLKLALGDNAARLLGLTPIQ